MERKNRNTQLRDKVSVWLHRVILILILIFIANVGGIIILIDTWHNPPLRQPNNNDYYIGSNEDIPFLEEALNEIFPQGTASLSNEEQVIEVLRFVVIKLKGRNNLGSATKILHDGYAVCGGKAMVFQTLVRQLGLPARTTEIFVTADSGHDLVEVYFEEDWHAFDPSYGVFVYSNPLYDKEGKINSVYAMRQKPSMGFVQSVTDTLASGQYSNDSKSYGVKPLFNNSYISADAWRNEINQGHPIIYGQKNLYKYFYMIKNFNTVDVKLKLSQIF